MIKLVNKDIKVDIQQVEKNTRQMKDFLKIKFVKLKDITFKMDISQSKISQGMYYF